MANGPVWGLCLLGLKGEPAPIDIDIDIDRFSDIFWNMLYITLTNKPKVRIGVYASYAYIS